jgi:CubicO group peptidase (beta-lactamase class C family)
LNGAYGGLGVFGQYLHVDPHTGMVIAKFSAQPRALDNGLNSATYRAFTAIAEFLTH